MNASAAQDQGGGFAEVGRRLKEARNKKGWSLQQVSERIHVATRYLDSIENGDMTGVPAPVYIRGFVINYARVLGLDEEAILRLLAHDDTILDAVPRPLSPTSRAAAREKARVSVLPDWRRNLLIIAGVIIAGVFLGLTVRGITRLFSAGTGEGVPPSPFEGGGPVSVEKPASASTTGKKVKTTALKMVTVSVTATQECWMQAQIDDDKSADIDLKPGDVKLFAGTSRVRLFIGNAAGVAVSGPKGPVSLPTRQGKVVHLLITGNGVERLKMPLSLSQSATVPR